ncbi:MAG: DUF4625 domain-containing protein [Cyclobacteriaceae bacterium]
MNTRVFLIAIVFAAGSFCTSCEKDDETNPKPVITLSELGYENSKIGYAGTDLHIEAEIVAEGKIDKVTVEIHPEGEHEEKSSSATLNEGEWEVDTTFTEFSGLKNTTFHKHIDIPVNVEVGHYHFHFIVTDMDGQQTTIEEELEIQQPDDAIAPEISISNAPTNNQEFNNGETISISGSVSDDKALGGMYIGLVRTDQNLTDAEVNATNTITLLHTHEFDSHTAHNFSASINVGAAKDNNITPKDITGDIAWQSANYYIVVKCKDAFGGNWTFSSHYPIVINY